LRKLLVAVRENQASASIIKKFLEETPNVDDWARRKAARVTAVKTPQRRRLRGAASLKPRPAPTRQPDVSLGWAKKKATKKSAAKEKTPEGAEPKKKTPFTTIRVFFGTDRKPTGYRNPDRFFAVERGELSLGSVKVSIPHDHRMGKLEAPPKWKLFFRNNQTKYILLLSLELFSQGKFIESFRKYLQQRSSRDALVFVHGYNVSFVDACRRTAQIAYDLSFKGVPIAYSWPSEGKTKQYLVDETNVHWSVPHFRSFLSLVLSKTGAEAVHVIAHSMGNRALVEALRTFDLSKLPVGSARLTQVICAAADIDAATFQEVAEEFRQKAARFTLYASSRDKALRASKAVHKYPRAGDSGEHLVLLDGLDTIDATEVNTGFMRHSYIGENRSILADVYDLLRGTPPPRFRLRRRERDGREYWMFKP
jgi:esterase/lipase superfamily enzyme